MIKLLIDDVERIVKNKQRLEKALKIKLSNSGKEFSINGEVEDEYFAEKVLEALDLGFPFSVAMLIREEDNIFEIINIKNYTKRKDLVTVRARVIGAKGKTLKALTELTKCHYELKNNFVGIIGYPEYIKNAQDSVIRLIQGAKQANVYAFLEKHQIQTPADLGLKEPKKKKVKKKTES